MCRSYSVGAVVLFLLAFCFTPSIARDTLSVSEIVGKLNLQTAAIGRYLYSPIASPNHVLRQSGWRSVRQAYEAEPLGYFWLQFSVTNDQSDGAYVDFLPSRADSVIMYLINGETSPIESQRSGRFIRPAQWLIPEQPELTYQYLAPQQTLTVLLRINGNRGRAFQSENFYVQTRAHTLNDALEGNRSERMKVEFNAFFFGVVVSMMLLFLLLYLRIGEKALLFYALYLLGVSAYTLIVNTLPYSRMAWAVGLDYQLAYRFNDPVQYLFLGAYVLFCIHLLDIDYRYPNLRKLMYTMAFGLLVIGAGLLVSNFVNYDYNFQKKVYVLARTIVLPLALLVIIWIGLDVRNPIKWFFLIGTLFFFGGGILAFLMDLGVNVFHSLPIPASPVIVFKTGVLLEILWFGVALGYKIKIIARERKSAQTAYIEQLEFNRRLVSGEKERLEEMVASRTAEVMKANEQLEYQRKQKLKSDFEKKFSELEIQALRSRINPAFIFDSLNAIRSLILIHDYEKADDYLMRFVRFLRKTLQNSRKHSIALSDELRVVELYLQLEQLRAGNRFEYTLTVSEEIDPDDITIPSMLFQPFLENVLKQKGGDDTQEGGRIDLNLQEGENGYVYEILTSGFVQKTTGTNSEFEQKNTPAFSITSERIDLFNRTYNQRITVSVENREDIAGGSKGDKVVIAHETALDNLPST